VKRSLRTALTKLKEYFNTIPLRKKTQYVRDAFKASDPKSKCLQ
jgi:hypothetical protein